MPETRLEGGTSLVETDQAFPMPIELGTVPDNRASIVDVDVGG